MSNVLPSEKSNNTIGRPAVPYRKVMDGIACVLRTGCQWKMLPRGYGSGSTCYRRFQQWVRLGIFKKLWISGLKTYDGIKMITWNWQFLDSRSVKSPLAGAMTGGSNPVDRGKLGTKRRFDRQKRHSHTSGHNFGKHSRYKSSNRCYG